MNRKDIKPKFWIFYHLGILGWALLTAGVFEYFKGTGFPSSTYIITVAIIFFTSLFIGYMAIFMTKRTEQLNQEQLRKRIIPALLIFYAASFLIANLVVTLSVLGWFIYIGRDLNEFFPHLFGNELNFANSSFAMWLMFFTIAFFFILWQKSSKREQALIQENLKYRYNTLRSQVNPHFLFNSLNTLSELVYEDAQKADSYIGKLSGIYRYILENEENDLISLKEELDFVKRYIDLHKERDAGKVKINLEIEEPHRFEIVPVSLQILIENALKHNEASAKSPLTINIFRKGEYLFVINNKQMKNQLEKSTSKGLSNLSERVKLITAKEVIIRDKDDKFEVLLPLISKES